MFTEAGHHGNTLTDGDAGSTDIPGISYNIYGIDTGGAKVGDILVASYTGYLDSHYFFVDDGTQMGLPFDKLVIESEQGEAFALKSLNVYDELGEAPVYEITGFRYGIPVATQLRSLNSGDNIQISLNTDFENVDRAEISNQNGRVNESFNSFVFDYPVTENSAPTVTTSSPTSITASGATLSGNVTDDGGDTVTERGFVYATTLGPTTSDSKIQVGSGTGVFEEDVTSLSAETTYYVRAYAINGEGTSYGSEESFLTESAGVLLSSSPTLTFTVNSPDITGDNIASDGEGGSQAISDIDVQVFNTSDEDGTFLSSLDWKGHDFLFSGDSNYSGLTYDNNNAGNKGMSVKSADGSEFRLIQFTYYNWGESESFTNTIKGYRNGTEVASMTFDGFDSGYVPITVTLEASFSNVDDVRIYISDAGWNGDGTTNHSINNIQVSSPVLSSSPIVTTSSPTSITSTGATLSGNVTDDGGDPVTERGIVYATTSGPTTSDTKIQVGSGTGVFEEDVTSLSAETTYYVRAYAINGAGTSYGSEESFTTTSLRTDITITSSAGSGSGWSISGGELTATSSVSVNFQDIEDALEVGDLMIFSTQDIIIDADIAPALSAERTLTLKADRDIALETNSSISATGFALNTILWSDADALEGGVVYLKNQAEILTHGGHLWIGGGVGSTTWNGLTVGDSTSVGNTNNSNGVTIVNSNIQTDGGNIALYGKGLPGAVAGVSIPISTGSSTNTNGVRMHDGNVINAGSGTIYMYGFADNSHSTSNANGVELSQTAGAGDVITSSNNTEQAIIIEGYAEGPASVSNSWGFYTHLSVIQNTGGGHIHIKGSAVKNSGVTVAGNGAVLANGGKIILEGIAAGDPNPNVLIQGAVGQKEGSDVTSTDAEIEIIGDRFFISGTAPNGSIQSSGGLVIRPYTDGTDIGIGSAAGTLQLPASYFNTNFADGFSEIFVGDENTGLITVEGATAYRDPLILKTNGSIVFTSDADVSSASANALTLWSRASGNNEANDAVSGTIWMPKGSSINTGGGDLTMGGGSDPNVGYAKGDNSAPTGENNARYRGVAMNGAVNAAGGSIIINGRASNNVTHARGVNIAGPVVTEGAGTITVRGMGVGSSDAIALGDSWFTPSAVGTLETETGEISLDGKPSGSTRNGLNVSTSGSNIKTSGNFSVTTTGRLTATAGALNIGGNTSLEAVDNITFTHVDNDFGGNITVNGAANLQVTDQNELTLGEISVNGTIDIATLGGDLTITENISTTNTTAGAIQIFADKNKNAGDPSGGNIKISNTPVINTGTGGQARFYSGSILESADLITLTGEENTWYEVDSSTTVFDPVLGSGNYALIREGNAPPVASNVSISGDLIYDQELTGSYDYTDAENDDESGTTLQWYRSDDGTGTNRSAITDSTNLTYILSKDDIGKYISFEVTPNDGTASGSAVESDFSGPVASPFAGGEGTEADPYEIATAEQLDYVRDFLDDDFILTADIDLGVSPWSDGDGWEPIGTSGERFSGSYDGNGHTISNLFINRPTQDLVGLIGVTSLGSFVINLHLENADVTGRNKTGGLIGESRATVSNVSVSGSVTGEDLTGGLIGLVENESEVTTSYSTADVTGTMRTGGLLGYIYGTLSNSYVAGGTVIADGTGDRNGGLIGATYQSTITNTYAANQVVGAAANIGFDEGSTYSNNFWDTVVTGQDNSIVGNGLPSEQLKTKSTFTGAGWDFDTVWQIEEPSSGSISYPYLQSNAQNPPPGFVSAELPAVVTHSAVEHITSGSAEVSGEVTDDGNLEITATGFVWSKDDAPGDTTMIYSGSLNETIADLPPGTTLNIRAFAVNEVGMAYGDPVSFETLPGELQISGIFTAQDKIYDGNTTAQIDQNDLTLDGVYSGHDVSFTDIEIQFSDSNAGEGLEVSLNSASIGGDDAGRYTLILAGVPTAAADITLRPITITADAVKLTFGEADPALTYEITSGSLVSGDELSGELSRVAGVEVGIYSIEQNTLSASENYELTYEPADFEITPRVLAIVADAGQGKTYGDADSELKFVVSNWDDKETQITGSLYRKAGEDAGTYQIFGDQLSVSGDYTIEYTSADFTIEPKELFITADAGQSKIYGEDDPEISFTVEGFAFDDDTDLLTGALSRELGEETGDYLITSGTINAGENYALLFEEYVFSILMTPPIAVQILPADGADGVMIDGPVVVEFDQPVRKGDFGQISLTNQNGMRVPIDVSVDENKVIITHEPLAYLATYQLAIAEGAVINRDGVENQGAGSSFITQVEVPTPVVLQGPYQNEGSVSVQPALTWHPSEIATHYAVQLSSDPEFGELLSDVQNHTELSFQINKELSGYTHYYWRVQASNSSGSSEWSESGHFVTVAKTPVHGFPAMMSEEISTAPVLQWTKEYSDAPVRVQLSTSVNFVELLADSVSAEASAQLTGLEDYHTYYWRLRIESDQTTSQWSDAMQFRTRKASSENDHEQVVENKVNFGHNPDAPAQNREITSLDYRLIGLPGNDNLRVDSFFEGRYGRDWKAFFDIGSVTEYYEEYHPDDERFVFAPGRGFWVLSKDVLDIELQTTSVKTNERDAYTIALQPGWNIISNPHRGVVSWSDVQELNNISGDLFGYEEQFIPADSLYPVLGYYYYNNVQNPLDGIDIPYSRMEQRRGEKILENNKLSGAAMSTSQDVANITADFGGDLSFGVELVYSVSDEHRGTYKRPFPSLEMSRRGMMLSDTDMYRGGYLRDEATFEAQGTRYDLELKGKVGSTFNWKAELSGLSSSAGVLLVNPVTKLSWLLESGEEAEATLTEPHTTYELYVGELNFLLEKQEELLPVEFALEQNYPNPFNPSTNIRYSIPDQEHVRLEVYDVMGRRVMVLQDGVQQAGWHNVHFNAGSLASGVYFYRLTAGEAMKVGRMTLIK